MQTLSEYEYRALRDAITARGHLRSALALAGLGLWAGLVVAVLIALPVPVAALVPLTVLWGTFEIIRPLHFGAERIGRYLQVFYEERSGADVPAWERTAMAFGASVPGAAGHPLFIPVFAGATLVNLLIVALPVPTPIEFSSLALPHASFLLWLARSDRAMRRQRNDDLARLRQGLRS
ncbi:MAG: hypothetical protein IT178_00310 [Acidobacteria bacterium]|nr:hypothetical protein [Acidobacteriota bacterium]